MLIWPSFTPSLPPVTPDSRLVSSIFALWRAGDTGPQIVELLKKNPGVAIQVVLARLNQKDEEWRRVKLEMKPLFSKVFQQNYHKSLDHRSFYFKQTDKKQLGHKAMLQVALSPCPYAHQLCCLYILVCRLNLQLVMYQRPLACASLLTSLALLALHLSWLCI